MMMLVFVLESLSETERIALGLKWAREQVMGKVGVILLGCCIFWL